MVSLGLWQLINAGLQNYTLNHSMFPFNPIHLLAKGPRRTILLSYAPDWWAWQLLPLPFSSLDFQDHHNCFVVCSFAILTVPTQYLIHSAVVLLLGNINGFRRDFSLEDTSYVVSHFHIYQHNSQSLKDYATRKFICHPSELLFRWPFLSISFAVHERVPVCWCHILVPWKVDPCTFRISPYA